MNFLIQELLNIDEIILIEEKLEKSNKDWENGKNTAGTHAAKVKINLQLKRNCEISKIITSFIITKLEQNHLIKSFCLPKNIHGLIVTKSKVGMKYGRHIDNTFMSTGRADLSFTLFLNDKNSYKGGELKIENINSVEKFKLNAGEILIYPSTYLHSVEEVIKGERTVIIGWIESYVKSIEEREYLFDLDAGARGLLARNGRSDELDLIFKSYTNLLRVLGN